MKIKSLDHYKLLLIFQLLESFKVIRKNIFVRYSSTLLFVLFIMLIFPTIIFAKDHKPLSELIYQPFPKGYGYMEHTKKLRSAVENKNQTYIREHAWKLWAGIMQPAKKSNWPLWMTWENSSVVFAMHKQPRKPKHSHAKKITHTLRQLNEINAPNVETSTPIYRVPDWVLKNYPNSVSFSESTQMYSLNDGKYFLSNGDIMIATESISKEGVKSIVENKFNQQSELNALQKKGEGTLETSQRTIVTKHMYWPVKKEGVTGLPVWKHNIPATYSGYVGYETWNTQVAVTSDATLVGKKVDIAYLHGIENADGSPLATVKTKATAYDINNFYHHKVSKADWKAFSNNDKAIINAASIWANNQPFEIGDYLVTVAMHVNTRELASWTLQSVWWSTTPNIGPYAANRPKLSKAKGPWKHYLLTEAYQYQGNDKGNLPIAVNPYIEGVIHPIATNCRNCHVRAGWPTASYQSKDCRGLLTALVPEDNCFKDLLLTDYLWIIPDRAK